MCDGEELPCWALSLCALVTPADRWASSAPCISAKLKFSQCFWVRRITLEGHVSVVLCMAMLFMYLPLLLELLIFVDICCICLYSWSCWKARCFSKEKTVWSSLQWVQLQGTWELLRLATLHWNNTSITSSFLAWLGKLYSALAWQYMTVSCEGPKGVVLSVGWSTGKGMCGATWQEPR